jgi:hypothetical protein
VIDLERKPTLTPEDFWQRVRRLIGRGATPLVSGHLSTKTQQELGRLIGLRLDIGLAGANEDLREAVDAGIAALEQDPPALALARVIRRDIESRVAHSASVQLVVVGAVASAGLALVIAVLLTTGNLAPQRLFFDYDTAALWWYGIAGAFGGTVSILLRIPDFARLNKVDASVQFYVGMFRAFIGGLFAVFLYILLSSHILGVSISVPPGQREKGFYLAVSFLAGFSERLIPTIAARAEGLFDSPLQTNAHDGSGAKGTSR